MRAAQEEGWTVLCLGLGHAMAEGVFRNQGRRPRRIACGVEPRWVYCNVSQHLVPVACLSLSLCVLGRCRKDLFNVVGGPKYGLRLRNAKTGGSWWRPDGCGLCVFADCGGRWRGESSRRVEDLVGGRVGTEISVCLSVCLSVARGQRGIAVVGRWRLVTKD